MAKAKKTAAPERISSQAELDYARAYYQKHKTALLKHKAQYRADVKAGKRKVAKGTKMYNKLNRAKWRKETNEKAAAKKAAKDQEVIDNFNKLYGKGSGNW